MKGQHHVYVPPIACTGEARELLRVASKRRVGVNERISGLTRVLEWIDRREREIADIERGAAHLLLQRAQQIGEELDARRTRSNLGRGAVRLAGMAVAARPD